jgi:hypothetical protein
MTLTADFALIVNQGVTPQTVTPGQTAMFINNIVVVPLFGYSATVNVSCAVPAAATTCSVSPASYETANGVGIGSIMITTTAPSAAAIARQPAAGPSDPPPFHLPVGRVHLLALLLCLFAILLTQTRRRRLALPFALLLLMAAIAPIGCGGGSGNSGGGPSPNAKGGTPAGTYTVTVTATAAGSTTHTTTLTLIVQ